MIVLYCGIEVDVKQLGERQIEIFGAEYCGLKYSVVTHSPTDNIHNLFYISDSDLCCSFSVHPAILPNHFYFQMIKFNICFIYAAGHVGTVYHNKNNLLLALLIYHASLFRPFDFTAHSLVQVCLYSQMNWEMYMQMKYSSWSSNLLA